MMEHMNIWAYVFILFIIILNILGWLNKKKNHTNEYQLPKNTSLKGLKSFMPPTYPAADVADRYAGPAQFNIGYDQIVNADRDGLTFSVKDMKEPYREPALKKYGETFFIPWSNLSNVHVSDGDSDGHHADYRFYLKDGDRLIKGYDDFEDVENKLSGSLIGKIALNVMDNIPGKEALMKIPFSIRRMETQSGQAAFLDYIRKVGCVSVTVACNIRD